VSDPNTLGHFFENFTTHMASVVIALIGFWTGFVRNLVNRKEVEQMIAAQSQGSQYSKDRQFIMERLNSHKEDTSILFRALEKKHRSYDRTKNTNGDIRQYFRSFRK
jgi:hypothetical protein